jgi:hypothetical protein
VLNSLAAEYFLELCLPSPRHELPTIVGKELSWCSPLANGTFDNFQNRIGCLLAK